MKSVKVLMPLVASVLTLALASGCGSSDDAGSDPRPQTPGLSNDDGAGEPAEAPAPSELDPVIGVDDREAFVAGLIEAVGGAPYREADGSALVLEAMNGDPRSFLMTIDAQGGTSAFTVPWSGVAALRGFRPVRLLLTGGSRPLRAQSMTPRRGSPMARRHRSRAHALLGQLGLSRRADLPGRLSDALVPL